MHHGPLGDILLLLVVGLFVVLIAQRLRVSALIAYLVTGALCAAVIPNEHPETIHLLGEIGAALLLFALGLEMDLPALRQRLKQVVLGAVLQIGSTILAGFLLMQLVTDDWRIALTIGCCLALSSTLMVLRALDENNLRNKETGQTVLGLLLAQDFCLAPLLILLSLLLPEGDTPRPPIWLSITGMTALIIVTVLLRRFFMSRLFTRIAAAKLPELEVAFSVTIAIGSAWVTDSVGLGAAVGAFCAGLAMGGDEHRHAIESATRPLQGLMAILFFISVGLQFDFGFIADNALLVVFALLVSIVLKAVLAGLALYVSGLPLKAAIGCGIMVGQVGEFSFVLAADGPLDADTYQLIVAVAVLSLTVTPLLVLLARRFLPRSAIAASMRRGETIVVAGMGPVGNTVVESLHSEGVPLLLVDRNAQLLAPWQQHIGIKTVVGRIEEMEDWLPLLEERPRVLILTFPIPDTSALVAERLHAIDPRLTIIARAPFIAQREILERAGVRHVICDEEATARAMEPLLQDALDDADRRRTARLPVERNPIEP